MLDIEEFSQGIRIKIKAQPRSSTNLVVGEQDGALKIKLTAPPVDGEANSVLIRYLADSLGLPRRAIKLIKGETSRTKIVEISGISKEEFLNRIGLKSFS